MILRKSCLFFGIGVNTYSGNIFVAQEHYSCSIFVAFFEISENLLKLLCQNHAQLQTYVHIARSLLKSIAIFKVASKFQTSKTILMIHLPSFRSWLRNEKNLDL